jgi:hypothetical protein
MRWPRSLVCGIVAAIGIACFAGDLSHIRSEPNLEKRSGLALQNALAAYQATRTAYDAGDADSVRSSIDEIEESVKLAYNSLRATGKNPRKSSKLFKKAEADTRDLMRRLDGLQQRMEVQDRALLDGVRELVQGVHDHLFLGLTQGTTE